MTEGGVDASALLDEQKIGPLQIRVAALFGTLMVAESFDIQLIGYLAPTLSREWSLPQGAMGPVFGAGLFGLLVGAVVFGPLGDRVRRKPIMICATCWFGLTSLLTVSATSMTELVFWRFVTGVGLGAAIPNLTALTCEYAPRRRRATVIMVMTVGFSVGSVAAGLSAAQLVPVYGWHRLLYVSFMLSAVLVPLLIVLLPESIPVLALRGNQDDRIRAHLARMSPTLSFPP